MRLQESCSSYEKRSLTLVSVSHEAQLTLIWLIHDILFTGEWLPLTSHTEGWSSNPAWRSLSVTKLWKGLYFLLSLESNISAYVWTQAQVLFVWIGTYLRYREILMETNKREMI